MARTDVAAAINARVVPVVQYDPDPRGWRLFTRLARAFSGGHTGRDGTRVLDLQARFTGLVDSPQMMSGMAPLGLARPITKDTSVLADERAAGVLNDTGLRIFAERLTRGK